MGTSRVCARFGACAVAALCLALSTEARAGDRDEPARPVAVYLHGLCGSAARGCATFRAGAAERAWLACPQAPAACAGGGSSWSTAARNLATIARAEEAVAREHPGVDLAQPRVLVGFSQGAYAAEALVRARPGRYRAAAFVAAFVRVTRASLDAAGVRRVVLAAGRRDLTYRHLRALAASLAADGVDVRFVDLGLVGHSYVPGAGSSGWRAALAWLAEGAAQNA